jgi:hypothetical protein
MILTEPSILSADPQGPLSLGNKVIGFQFDRNVGEGLNLLMEAVE